MRVWLENYPDNTFISSDILAATPGQKLENVVT